MTPEIPIDAFTVFASGLDHPECVAFDREGYLWAGGEAGQVYRIAPDGAVLTVANIGGFCAGLAFSPAGELFVCNVPLGVVRVTPSGAWSVVAGDMICANYPVFDRHGNLYVTDSGKWKQGNGRVLRFAPDGAREVFAGPFGYANGLALSAGERYLFVVESDTDRIFRVEIASGRQEVWAQDVGRLPDGLAFDDAGNLYASCYASDDIYRISPSREKTLFACDPYAILLSRPTNMAFWEDWIYVANLGRYTITRARIGRRGQPLAHQS